MSDLALLRQEIAELTAALEQEKRFYKFVVDQRDRAWRELDALKKLHPGTTKRKEKMAQSDLFIAPAEE